MNKNLTFSRRGQGGITRQGLSHRVASCIKSCRVAFILALLPLTGCVSTQSIVTGQQRAPVPVESVKVYPAAPAGAEEIAIVNVSADKGYATAQGVMDLCVKALKVKAAALGANGIVIVESGVSEHSGIEFGTFVPQSGLFLANSTTKKVNHVSAKAIYVR